MSEVTILHVSDLHMESKHLRDIRIILKALYADLVKLRGESVEPDIVVFTGDLVNAGSNADEFGLAESEFIKPLMGKLGLSNDRFFFVPGNHDIDKDEWEEDVGNGIRVTYTTTTKLNKFFDTKLKLNKDKYFETLRNFIAFKDKSDKLHMIESNNLFSLYQLTINGVKLGIGCLNSALLAYGGDVDKGKLLVCERQVDRALENIKDCDVKIALMHHPLEWLMPFDRTDVENRLRQEFDFL
ncbi:MAG: metallophosphoesterase [Nitrospirae bacterium]|uniref:metallophosphoesterase family protein n=1 Tax=Candidatus Magnetobacterium casense TaxID=1455061 RepID=UPI00058DF467|nr:metallophosphoesterase [Candidatus Magnetobacterium casensis]MBF0339304.1 metallophosphoesterase [Nitrospirota bacterium]